MPAIPPTSSNVTVLITGANGYIGAWVVRTALERGYSVRAVVRAESKSASLREIFGSYIDNGKLTFNFVEDMTKEGAYDEAVQGVDAVLHLASPLPLDSQSSDPQTIIRPAVEGTLAMLKSAAKAGNNIKRVVITSSTAAIVTNDLDEPRTFSEADWNERVIKQVEEGNVHYFLFYRASKILAEKAAWSFYNENKSSIEWDITTINPPYVYGPSLEPHIASPSDIGGTQQMWWNKVIDRSAEAPTREVLGPRGGHTWVDVRDLAEAHVRALERNEAGGERIIISGGPYIWQEWIDVTNALAPLSIQRSLPKGYPELTSGDIPYHIQLDASKSERLLGMSYRTKEELVRGVLADVGRRGWSEVLAKGISGSAE